MKSSSDLGVESAIRSEGLGWSARSGFSVNAGALFPASVRYLRYGQRVEERAFTFPPARTRYVYVRVQEGRIGAKYKPGLKPA